MNSSLETLCVGTGAGYEWVSAGRSRLSSLGSSRFMTASFEDTVGPNLGRSDSSDAPTQVQRLPIASEGATRDNARHLNHYWEDHMAKKILFVGAGAIGSYI